VRGTLAGVLILFVHGALVTDAGWWWHRMVEPLAALGHRTAAVELPSCGAGGDLYADADAVHAAVEAAGGTDEPVVLVGHSYGGTVITDAGAGAAHLVYVSSVMADETQPHGSFGGPAPWVRPGREEGTVELVVDDELRRRFFADCDEQTWAQAAERAAPQTAAAFGQPPRQVAWRTVRSTYVVCTEDGAIPAQTQRGYASRAGAVVELATGHHPFLSAPDLFAAALARIAE
jgi:pimeloyl-ACP methyl ester carboxylesterase